MEKKKVAVLVGSLRKESFSKKIAKNLKELAPESVEMHDVDISDLAIFNQDLDDLGKPPAPWTAFRELMKQYDAVLFITPEYNRSVPPVLKNALDVGSRPYGQSVWDGKPCAVVSVSPGGLSGFGANHHLRQSLVFLNMPTLQQPEAYIGSVATLLDANGVLINEETRGFLKKFMDSFGAWVEINAPKRSYEYV